MRQPDATPTIADPWSGRGDLRVRLYALVRPPCVLDHADEFIE
jgi:hypothetical protein